MKKTILIPALLILSLAAIFQACHTHPFQNVNEQISGDRWSLLPVTANHDIQFQFTGDSIIIYENGQLKPVEDIDGKIKYATGYTVRNKISNQYLVIDPSYIQNFGLKGPMFERTRQWLVIKSSSDELFLESIGKDDLKGEYQLEFYRE